MPRMFFSSSFSLTLNEIAKGEKASASVRLEHLGYLKRRGLTVLRGQVYSNLYMVVMENNPPDV